VKINEINQKVLRFSISEVMRFENAFTNHKKFIILGVAQQTEGPEK